MQGGPLHEECFTKILLADSSTCVKVVCTDLHLRSMTFFWGRFLSVVSRSTLLRIRVPALPYIKWKAKNKRTQKVASFNI